MQYYLRNIQLKHTRLLLVAMLFLAFFASKPLEASHIRAGEIIAKRVSNTSFKFEITLVVYLKESSGVPYDSATIEATDGWTETQPFSSAINVGNDITKVTYIYTHTFNSGQYIISHRDQNRVSDVLNMDNSGNTAFYIETMLVLDPLVGLNNTPELLVPPIDEGAKGQVYNYNPGAYDVDGDSLTYVMDIPMSNNNTDVANYRDPGTPEFSAGLQELVLGLETGNLEWDVPNVPGIYNIAYRINEWRDGVLISYIHRDMQIQIVDTDNDKPELQLPEDTCALVNEILYDTISATDPDNDDLDLSMFFALDDQTLLIENDLQEPSYGYFAWMPGCEDVREKPYQIIFKADDAPSRDPSLVDIETWNVKVNGPKVENFQILEVVDGSKVGYKLTWDDYACKSEAEFINIYRRKCELGGSFDECLSTTPEQLGYTLIASVPATQTAYTDFGPDSSGLYKSVTYCYLAQAAYPEPQLGIGQPSDIQCDYAGEQFPVITKVSVLKTDSLTGIIEINWRNNVDTSGSLFNLFRGTRSGNTVTYQQIATSLSDTFYVDSNLNTQEVQYFYKIQAGSMESDPASSVFLNAESFSSRLELDWQDSVPWSNFGTYHTIYYYNKTEGDTAFQTLDSVYVLSKRDQNFTHDGLNNYDTLCYYVVTKGTFCNDFIKDSLINNSQERCFVPKDEVPPCPPEIDYDFDCNISNPYSITFDITPYVNKDAFCYDDVVRYQAYYKEYLEDTVYELIVDTTSSIITVSNDMSVAGCYYISVVDDAGNVSPVEDTICIDNEACLRFELPNVITPNADSINSLFVPIPPVQFVKSVTFQAFNRWGKKVFETENVDILWDASDIPSGTYYYSADVEFYRLSREDEHQVYRGWVEIVR